jgi:SAM-dependent methyltransferase
VVARPHTPAFAAYEAFAQLYDVFTEHHNYEAWISSIESVALRHGLKGRRVLDVACGTAKSVTPWVQRGYEISGCDLSPRMLDIAAEKTAGRVELFQADMRALPPGAPVDLLTCLDDAVNYLLTTADLRLAFAAAARRLARGGLYVFDINTLRVYRQEFATTHSSANSGWAFDWIGHGDGTAVAGNTGTATIVARRNGSRRANPLLSRHVQRHHPIADVVGALDASGMRPVAVYGLHRDGSLDSHLDESVHTKALVVATTNDS